MPDDTRFWLEDSRLVVLNARDAANRGAVIRTRTLVESAQREGGLWRVRLRDAETGASSECWAKGLVNAGGPWVEDILNGRLHQNSTERVRLVRGSHIVTKRLFDHDQPYFLQLADGRIVFAIPYETDFTLIGTTDHDFNSDPGTAVCTPEEQSYLIAAVNTYFDKPVTPEDVVWSFSGVRPLYDDHASDATAATRDYVLSLSAENGRAPLLNVFGGKITTYRKLSEEALKKLSPYFPAMGKPWTKGAPLPGGDFRHDQLGDLIARLLADYAFLSEQWATRLVRAYGTDAFELLSNVRSLNDMGEHFGATLTAREVDWLIEHEWVRRADDIVWRRTKTGLRLTTRQIAALDAYVNSRLSAEFAETAE